MQFRSFYFWTLLLVIAFFYGCREEKAARVVIISTNDMHAQIGRFPQLATLVDDMRKENPYVLLVDGGDRFSGNVYVDHAVEKGKPIIELMNKVHYDLATFGNHDFDYGQTVLRKRMEEAEFPFICANIQAEGSELGQPVGYAVLEEGGLRLCFLGLIQTSAVSHIPATNPENLKNITFSYYQEAARRYKELRKKCDAFIGLTHLGYTSDSLLAMEMPELDAIIGGHSHTLVREPKLINGVLVSQTGSNLKYAGITTLEFKGKKLVNKTFRVVKLDTVKPMDAEVKKMVEDFSNRPEFLVKIGTTSKGLKHKENVASLMADAMCYAADCDFAFCNSGGVRSNSIPAGDITMENMYKIEPFGNYIVTHELTLAEMKELILNRFNGLNHPEKRRIDLFISQGRYTLLKNAEGEGIDVVFVDKEGHKLQEGPRKYKVGLSNYVSTTYDFAGKGKGEDTGIYLVNAMENFVKSRGNVDYSERRTFINKK